MRLIIRSLIVIIIIALLGGYLFYIRGINKTVSDIGQDVTFIVGPGQSVKEIGENLHQAGLIESKFFFKVYAWRTKNQSNFQAGEYVLNPGLNIKEIAKALVSGESLNKERTVTIIEGWTSHDINEYLLSNRIVNDDSFLVLAQSKVRSWPLSFPKPLFLNNAPTGASLEGYLFPDSYRIYKDAIAEDIILKMLNNFNEKLSSQMRDEITKQDKTIHEIITMASIIEKEVRTEQDLKIASGIFWDRIKNKQALQSDATLTYLLGDEKPQHSIEETEIDSKYNTYKYLGLPPGPISNPGLNAIKAAIYPEFTDYNYFLNRLDTGETIFSKTLEEHNKYKARYLK